MKNLHHNRPVHTPYDLFEPAEGHEARFRAKLLHRMESNNRQRNNRRRFFMLAAASVLLFLALNIWLPSVRNLYEDSPLVAETQQLIRENETINRLIAASMESLPVTNAAQKELVHNTLSRLEKMEKDYRRLLEIYKSNPNEKVLEALILNLKKRMEMLEDLKSQMEEIDKIKNHERTTS